MTGAQNPQRTAMDTLDNFEKSWEEAEARLAPLAARISFKGLKVNKTFSRETLCFTATILLDGSPAATAENDGNGGCTFVVWNSPTAREVFGAEFSRLNGAPLDEGSFIDSLVDRAVDEKEWSRYVATQGKKGRTAVEVVNAEGARLRGHIGSTDPAAVAKVVAKWKAEGKQVVRIA